MQHDRGDGEGVVALKFSQKTNSTLAVPKIHLFRILNLSLNISFFYNTDNMRIVQTLTLPPFIIPNRRLKVNNNVQLLWENLNICTQR